MLVCRNMILHSVHFLFFYYFDRSISPTSHWFFASELPFSLFLLKPCTRIILKMIGSARLFSGLPLS